MKSIKHIVSIGVVGIFITLFIASASANAVYQPPKQDNSKNNFTKVINKSFDKVWEELINYSASTFFGIENFEKESGLLTLSFGANNPEEYITGGNWNLNATSMAGDLHFNGDYVKYVSLYQNGTLVGKMNIVLKKISEEQTQIIVNAKYVFTSSVSIANQGTYNNTWSFNTGGCKEVVVPSPASGTPPTRTICPTYKAEKAILDALE